MSKSFTTAVKERVETAEGEVEEGLLSFDLDGEPLEAHEPEPSQLALLMHAAARYTSTREAVAGFLDFFFNVMDDRHAQHIRARLLDRKDDFGLDEVEEIVAWMVEEWTGVPFKRPSDSSSSRKSTGPRSTSRSRR